MSVASIPCPAGINGTCYPTPVYRFIEENQSLQILPQYKAGGEKRWGGFGPRRKIQAGYVDTEKSSNIYSLLDDLNDDTPFRNFKHVSNPAMGITNVLPNPLQLAYTSMDLLQIPYEPINAINTKNKSLGTQTTRYILSNVVKQKPKETESTESTNSDTSVTVNSTTVEKSRKVSYDIIVVKPLFIDIFNIVKTGIDLDERKNALCENLEPAECEKYNLAVRYLRDITMENNPTMLKPMLRVFDDIQQTEWISISQYTTLMGWEMTSLDANVLDTLDRASTSILQFSEDVSVGDLAIAILRSEQTAELRKYTMLHTTQGTPLVKMLGSRLETAATQFDQALRNAVINYITNVQVAPLPLVTVVTGTFGWRESELSTLLPDYTLLHQQMEAVSSYVNLDQVRVSVLRVKVHAQLFRWQEGILPTIQALSKRLGLKRLRSWTANSTRDYASRIFESVLEFEKVLDVDCDDVNAYLERVKEAMRTVIRGRNTAHPLPEVKVNVQTIEV